MEKRLVAKVQVAEVAWGARARRLYQHWRSRGEAKLNGKVSKNTERFKQLSHIPRCRVEKQSGSEWFTVFKLALMIRWATGVWARSSSPPRKTTASHTKHRKKKPTQPVRIMTSGCITAVLQTVFFYFWRQSSKSPALIILAPRQVQRINMHCIFIHKYTWIHKYIHSSQFRFIHAKLHLTKMLLLLLFTGIWKENTHQNNSHLDISVIRSSSPFKGKAMTTELTNNCIVFFLKR